MKEPFTTDMFTPTKWDTAADKLLFARQFVKFVESGFSKNYFTKKFYNRLMNCFGNIAHYDIHGFWATFFTSDVDKLDFIKQCLSHPCYGDTEYTFSDVERVLIKWLVDYGVEQTLRRDVEEDTETAERAELTRLKEKYES